MPTCARGWEEAVPGASLHKEGSMPAPPVWGGAPTFSGEQSKPRKVTPFLNEIELPFSSSSQMSAALDQIRS